MEMSLVGCSNQPNIISRPDFSPIQALGLSKSNTPFSKNNQLWFHFNKINICNKSRLQFALKATAEASRLESDRSLVERCLPEEGVRLFVGLPQNAVSDCNRVNHAKAIGVGLKALKLLGCEGVEVPIWWGIVEKESMGKYDWSGYLALAKMVQEVGLKLRVSICFHGSDELKVPLPQWISKIGEAQPDIFFTDRSGNRYKQCLSYGVDELPVLGGKSPMQVYQGFLESFKSSFSDFMGSTITDISVGLGPNGELRYPSCPSVKPGQTTGAGEFQCFDKHLLSNLKQHAQETGNPNWGLGGPHDAPNRYESPKLNSFFKDGGSWETPYGDFFLSWYSNQLISHGERLLSIASTTLGDSTVNISGKVPLLHSLYKMRSHPAEVSGGFYNTISRDGYSSIAEMFARNSCRMILPGMELSDKTQPGGLLSSPELLLSQIKRTCQKHGVKVYGENSKVAGKPEILDQIKQNLVGGDVNVDLFTYQRMGAQFFSPEHFPSFAEFARSLDQPELHSDDLIEHCDAAIPLRRASKSGKKRHMQEA